MPDRGTINDLAIIGICRRDAPFRNRIYQRVFGHRGTLSLFDSDSSLTTKDLFPYDVFLSYSSKDNAVVRELAERLRRDGVRVWFDGWELRPGDNILAAIEDGLEHSRVLVLCMSAHAFGADWAQLEAGTFRFRDPLNADRRFLPLRLDDAPIKSALAQFLYINWLPQNRERGYAELLDALEWEKGVVRAEMSTGLNPSEERFLHLDHRPLIGEPVTEGNPISRHFGQLVQSVYSEEHFPRGMDAYKQEEVAYYVHDRITLSEYDGSPGPSPRSVSDPPHGTPLPEATMDDLFWDQRMEKIIFVEGIYGVGKSLFVDYYLRYYFPNAGKNRRDFAKTLIVNVNLRALSGSDGAEATKKHLFRLLRPAIDTACKAGNFDIERYRDKEFFDFALDREHVRWDSFKKEAQSNSWTDDQLRQEMIATAPSVEAEKWFSAACTFLSQCRQRGDFPFKYFVFVLDNLDQTTLSALEVVINATKSWLENYSDLIWRIVIPVRPKTLRFLLSRIEPYGHLSVVLSLSAPHPDSVLSRREILWNSQIDTAPYKGVPQNVRKDASEFVATIHGWLANPSRRLLFNVAFGSTRIALSMWRNAIQNRLLYDLFRDRKDPGVSLDISSYYLLYGILSGGYEAYRREAHPILNVFDWEVEGGSPHDTLLGPHFIHILRAPKDSRTRVFSLLGRLGYAHRAMSLCLEKFQAAHLLFLDGDDLIETVVPAVNGYRQLLYQPAYIDSMSMVTPLDGDRRTALKRPATLRGDDAFRTRVRNGISFLRYLRQREETFALGTHLAEDRRPDFFDAVQEAELAFFWKPIGRIYKNILRSLKRRKGVGLVESEWRTFLEREPLVNLVATVGGPVRPGDLMSKYTRQKGVDGN